MTEMPQSTTTEFDISKVLSSRETYGDPALYDVLQWHIRNCEWCRTHENYPPPEFGKFDYRKCPEYFEIAQEYSDYERDYIMKGDP